MIIKLSHLATKNLIIKIVIDISFGRCDNDLVGKLILLNQIENNFQKSYWQDDLLMIYLRSRNERLMKQIFENWTKFR